MEQTEHQQNTGIYRGGFAIAHVVQDPVKLGWVTNT